MARSRTAPHHPAGDGHPESGPPPAAGAVAEAATDAADRPALALLPARWHVWIDPPADGVTNMATDLALGDVAVEGRALWRWYGWSHPTVSFGRHEVTRGRFDAAAIARAGLAAVRRPTGGRALLHHREITYAVAFPLAKAIPWRAAYEAVNALLGATLRRAGVPVRAAAASPPLPLDGPVCFDRPAEGELTVGDRKLVGSAVWRQDGLYLQHGSILLHDDQHRLGEASLIPLPPAPPAATLATVSPLVTVDTLQADLTALLGEQGRVVTSGHDGRPAGIETARDARRPLVADASWLWRR